MELNPILELNTLPKEGMWYVLSGMGESPSMRVGHTATFIRSANQVLVVGGANPDGAFAEHYRLCLKTLSWDRVDGPAQLGRYEHAAFQTEARARRLYVFAGAGTDANRCDVVYVDVCADGAAGKWKALSPLLSGEPPSPRTYHVGQAACHGDHLYVFSGGLAGAEAVSDTRVHRLSVGGRRWEALDTVGEPPGPRQGHAVAATEAALLVHGGMHAGEFFDSLHRLDLRGLVWSTVGVGGGEGGGGSGGSSPPCARAGHGAAIWRQRLLVFGGLGRAGALNDLHACDLETHQWTRIDVLGDPPQPRLDFALCLCDLEIRPERDARPREDEAERAKETGGEGVEQPGDEAEGGAAAAVGEVSGAPQQQQEQQQQQQQEQKEQQEQQQGQQQQQQQEQQQEQQEQQKKQEPDSYLVTCLLVNGGMDTVGNIFDDTLAFPLAIRCLVSDS